MEGSKNSRKTPRPYLSYSQLTLFERSEEEYIQRYFLGQSGFENDAMRLGSEIAEALAQDESTNPEAEYLRTFLPSYPKREHPVKCTFQGIPLYGRFDGWDGKRRRIGELKTGTAPWTQRRADNHDQLTFYHLLLLGSSGRPPGGMALHWAPTARDKKGVLRLTGEIKTFETARTLRDVADLTKRIRVAWKRIKEISKEIQVIK